MKTVPDGAGRNDAAHGDEIDTEAEKRWEAGRAEREERAQESAAALICTSGYWLEAIDTRTYECRGSVATAVSRCMANLHLAIVELLLIRASGQSITRLEAITAALSYLQRVALDAAYADELDRIEREGR